MVISSEELAKSIHVSYELINELVNRQRGVTPSIALRLAKLFGNSPEFWLNLQQNWELYHVFKEEQEDLKAILNFGNIM